MSTFVITVAATVPRNRALDRGAIDTTEQQCIAREHFEVRWNRGNLARALTSTASLAMLTTAGVV